MSGNGTPAKFRVNSTLIFQDEMREQVEFLVRWMAKQGMAKFAINITEPQSPTEPYRVTLEHAGFTKTTVARHAALSLDD